MMEELISVLIVDDQPSVRVDLQEAIQREADLMVAGMSRNAPAAAEKVRSEPIDVAVGDLELDLLPAIQNEPDAPAAVVYSSYDGTVFAGPALRAGARGYVSKDEPIATVVEAIRAAAGGEAYLPPELREQLIHELTGSSDANGQPPKGLSDRELSVFQMIGAKTTTGKIAERLHLARSTVEPHRRHVREKLGHETDRELVQDAIRNPRRIPT